MTARLSYLAALVSIAAACGSQPPGLATDTTPTENESPLVLEGMSSSNGSRFQYGGRHYSPSCAPVRAEAVDPDPLVGLEDTDDGVVAVRRLEDVDPDVLLAVEMPPGTCPNLDPEARWRSAMAVAEVGPSTRLNDAMCQVAVYAPDPAEGFSC